MFFYVGNYGGPLRTEVFALDGMTPVMPSSATVTILNMDTGTALVTDAICGVATGSAFYPIPSGSPVTASGGHMVAYMDVLIETGNLQTNPIHFDVLTKDSFLIIEQWRTKVKESSPADELIEDEDARDWVDAAVAYVNKRWGDKGYTSVLGSISPTPDANTREFYASVASLMARTSWHAGRGKWRDEELSMDPGPFMDEWARLDAMMAAVNMNDLLGGSGINSAVVSAYNRDMTRGDGYVHDADIDYWYSGTTTTL